MEVPAAGRPPRSISCHTVCLPRDQWPPPARVGARETDPETLPGRRCWFGGAHASDPPIYRFYEPVPACGTTWQEPIQEEFGDGILSAIDFDMTMARLPDRKGDRVKLVMSGKFLGCKTYRSFPFLDIGRARLSWHR